MPVGCYQDSDVLDELQKHLHWGCSLVLLAGTPWGFSAGRQQAGLCAAIVTLKILPEEPKAPALRLPTLLGKGLEVHFGMAVRKSTSHYPFPSTPA